MAPLPIHFFTIVLNGEPFIRHHLEVFRRLGGPWHWHIVEGVADLHHDSSWAQKRGGRVPEALQRAGLSSDGTSEYLDEIARAEPERITLYRQPDGARWDGKRAMVAAPLVNIREGCLLFQVDADELWSSAQLERVRQLFADHPERTAAWYWCWFFVGEDRVVRDDGARGWSRHPRREWLRTWRFSPGMRWASHSPPVLVETKADGRTVDVGQADPFFHHETAAHGLRFAHYAYATAAQLEWKEIYYGYSGALRGWDELQKETQLPVRLREFFSWVNDDSEVALAPDGARLAERDERGWRFRDPPLAAKAALAPTRSISEPTIVIDGFFYQRLAGGIGRVWSMLLQEWGRGPFGARLLLLDRAHTAPLLSGLRRRVIAARDYGDCATDRARLQRLCDEEGAALLVSTYYTTAATTPTVTLVHDLIPEVLGWDLTAPMWRDKHEAITTARALVAVSHHTAFDVARYFPSWRQDEVTVAHPGVGAPFTGPPDESRAARWRCNAGITRPYFVVFAALGSSYKNTNLFYRALADLPDAARYAVVSVGGDALDREQAALCAKLGVAVHHGVLNDVELADAYRGAIALVYPSGYEGFGLPALEAMAAGCPVIACPVASLPEVLGDAGIYVAPADVAGMTAALVAVQRPEVAARCRERGSKRAQRFTWAAMAQLVKDVLVRVAAR